MWRMKREKAGLGCDADLTLVKGKRGASRGGWREPQTVSILHIVLDNIMGGAMGGFRTDCPLEESCTGQKGSSPRLLTSSLQRKPVWGL